MRTVRAGVAAFYLYLGAEPSPETSLRLRALQLALQSDAPPGLRDIVIGYTSLLLEHDPAARQDDLMAWARSVAQTEPELAQAQHHDLRIVYGLGADREELERRLELSWDEIVAHHSGATYTVAFNGFTHGFPYLLGLPETLRLPRRDTPRKRIEAGSVAIAAGQAGIYPVDSPGGWWVLGKTDARLYDASRAVPLLLEPGDSVRFVSVGALGDLPQKQGSPQGEGPLEVVHVWPNTVSVQGPPRWGGGAYSALQGGVLDPVGAELANEIIGNEKTAPCLEIFAQAVTFRLREALTFCLTGGGLRLFIDNCEAPYWRALEAGAGSLLELIPGAASGHVSYLAVQGGFASRDGPLSPGDAPDVTGRAASGGRRYRGRPRYPDRIEVRLHPGPQYSAAAFDKLLGSSFRVEHVSRMGVRLSGARVELGDHGVLSEGSPWGAVQVPASGQPIILLSDRGRTGGYAKPAVCDVGDLWQFAQAGPGTEVWFTAAKD